MRGGAELLAEWLVLALKERGHLAELVRIPFAWTPPARIADSMLAARLVRLPDVDRVVALKFPAYYVPHRRQGPVAAAPVPSGARAVGNAAAGSSQHAGRRRCARRNTGRRPQPAARGQGDLHDLPRRERPARPPRPDWARRSSTTRCVTPPATRASATSRSCSIPAGSPAGKRQLLAVEAMAHVPAGVRLVIAGAPETPADLERLHETVDRLGARRPRRDPRRLDR